MAATNQLCELVVARHGFWRRQREAKTLFSLHKTVGTSTRATIRATILYVLPVKLRPIIGPLLS